MPRTGIQYFVWMVSNTFYDTDPAPWLNPLVSHTIPVTYPAPDSFFYSSFVFWILFRTLTATLTESLSSIGIILLLHFNFQKYNPAQLIEFFRV